MKTSICRFHHYWQFKAKSHSQVSSLPTIVVYMDKRCMLLLKKVLSSPYFTLRWENNQIFLFFLAFSIKQNTKLSDSKYSGSIKNVFQKASHVVLKQWPSFDCIIICTQVIILIYFLILVLINFHHSLFHAIAMHNMILARAGFSS